jgi:hypothetical protein
MDAIGNELEENKVILEAGIQYQVHWEQKMQGLMKGHPKLDAKPESMSDSAFQFKQWCDQK